MTKRIPLVATAVVVVAIAIMIGLGLWQLQRMHWKDALLARYSSATRDMAEVAFPQSATQREELLYRRSRFSCGTVLGQVAVSGRNAQGQAGWAQTVRCRQTNGGGEATIVLGWSRQPATASWSGGTVIGVIGPGASGDVRLIAAPPLAGLEANALPDPRELPNNHLSYAVQWFLFAATAAIIYAIALWKRLAGSGSDR